MPSQMKKEEKRIGEKKPDILGQNSLSQIVMGSWDSGELLIVLSFVVFALLFKANTLHTHNNNFYI